ncbi:MAG: alpha-glucuronidase [Clostridiales bacterium]|nr:alpha-glucuronidase [Clostridiales bacterium]
MYSNLWLNYQKVSINDGRKKRLAEIFQSVSFQNIERNHPVMVSIMEELELAALAMFGQKVTVSEAPQALCLQLMENTDFTDGFGNHQKPLELEGYSIWRRDGHIVVLAVGYEGLLYGTYALLSLLRQGKGLEDFCVTKRPSNPLRMLNHWDNMDGSIERGYAGNSFFFADNELCITDRTVMYARAVASVGINAVVINNVNVKDEATYLISDRHYSRLRELSELFSRYAIRLFVSINYAMPLDCGCGSADPLDGQVIKWWTDKCNEIYDQVPLLGGFLVKADSEGRPGPFTYNRNQADGANMLAKAIAPHNGLIIWRCFVYNCMQDWRDKKTDRARAGYDYFKNLDGRFDDNVILQIKNGPMDFQVREPISPLFGGLTRTNQMLEVQIAQEYTGQQIHLCYLIPWFKQILQFQTGLKNARTENATVAQLISGEAFLNKNCGMAAVCNTGDDDNWTGHDMAAANLYGFGRLSFDSELSAEEIALEWIRLFYLDMGGTESTAPHRQEIEEIILEMLIRSWGIYEKYNAPLGIGWMVVPHHHYGPDVDGYEYSRWGTYHRADHMGIGVDRTGKGTGFTQQYLEPNASMYEQPHTTPEELLLFFHHLPYTYRLKTGKSIIQHIYDSHFEGVQDVEEMIRKWSRIEQLLPQDMTQNVTARLSMQLESAKEWRDVINSYFYRKSGIPDEHRREIY